MTKANIVQLGLLLFFIGGLGYAVFVLLGFDQANVAIASEVFLIFLISAWVGSYFWRVLTGNMTFMEQRKRYIEKYQEITEKELKEKFDSMTDEEKISFIKDLELKKKDNE